MIAPPLCCVLRAAQHELAETVLKIHRSEPSGDILCFLTGADEIEQVCALIAERCAHTNIRLCR